MILADAAARLGPEARAAFTQVRSQWHEEGELDLALRLAWKAVHRPPLHDEALRLIESVHAHLRIEPRPGGEQVDYLVKCSRLAGAVDEGAGRHYFEAAVSAAAEIDEEAHHLLRSLSALAKRAASDNGGVREHPVANAFAAVVEACHWRLGDSDRFPWAECVEALTSLSPGMAAVAMARWDSAASSPSPTT
jgi:hypothetical protein